MDASTTCTITSETSVKDDDICPTCGIARTKIIPLYGITHRLPNKCQCQRDKEQQISLMELMQTIEIFKCHWEVPAGKTFDSWNHDRQPTMREIWTKCRDYAQAWRPGAEGFTLVGTNGTGKSHLVNATCLAIADLHIVKAIAVETRILFRMLKPDGGGSLADLLVIPVLGVNDVAKVRTEWEIGVIHDIVDGREGKTTIVSADISLAAWSDMMEDKGCGFGVQARRILSRLSPAPTWLVPKQAADYRPLTREARGV